MAGDIELPTMATEVSQNSQLVPANATQFPGSFAPHARYEKRKIPHHRKWRAATYAYLAHGWSDINIWKSAVGVSLHVKRPSNILNSIMSTYLLTLI